MAEFDRPNVAARPGTAVGIDEGLRSYMLRVYNYMGLGLVVTGIVAYALAQLTVTSDLASAFTSNGDVYPVSSTLYLTQIGVLLYTTPLMWVLFLAPLAFVLVLSFGVNRLSVPAMQALFWAFAAVMGASLSSIFLRYTGASIAQVFFITAATFGAMSLYGYTTKRDLTAIGSFLYMGLIGLVIAGIVSYFFGGSNPMFSFLYAIVGVVIFVGLTAYDTQKIKENYNEGHGPELLAKGAIMGALNLYLDFINLFMMLLRLFGNRN